MVKSVSLRDDEQMAIFRHGREAALARANPFACPYLNDTDERFAQWFEGFRSIRPGFDPAMVRATGANRQR